MRQTSYGKRRAGGKTIIVCHSYWLAPHFITQRTELGGREIVTTR
jgi:hypothetical protein